MAGQEEIGTQTASQAAISPRERELYETMRTIKKNKDLLALLWKYRHITEIAPIIQFPDMVIRLTSDPITGEFIKQFGINLDFRGFYGNAEIVFSRGNQKISRYEPRYLNDDGTGIFYSLVLEGKTGKTGYIGKYFPELTGGSIVKTIDEFLAGEQDIIAGFRETIKSQNQSLLQRIAAESGTQSQGRS